MVGPNKPTNINDFFDFLKVLEHRLQGKDKWKWNEECLRFYYLILLLSLLFPLINEIVIVQEKDSEGD